MEPNAPEAPAPAEAAPSPAPNPEKVEAAKALVAGILSRMGVTAELLADDRPDGIHLTITASAGGEMLAGGRGGVVESIGYLVNKAINRDEEGRKWVFVAVAGGAVAEAPVAAGNVEPGQRALAEALAAKARKAGGTLWIGPVPPAWRGLSSALAGLPGVKVRTEGEGVHRRVIVEAS